MSQIILDDELRARLNGFKPGSEVRDASGKLLGYFISPESFAKFAEAWEKQKAADQAELDRISQESEEWTLEEIWKELGHK
jgi:hypothetical protein